MGATTVAGGLLGIDVGGTKVALRAEAVGGSADRTVEAAFTWPAARSRGRRLAGADRRGGRAA